MFINLNEALCDKLIKLSSPKFSTSITGVKFMQMEHVILLKKMDPKTLKETPAYDSYCYTHECKHCKTLISFRWKINKKLKSKPTSGPGA